MKTAFVCLQLLVAWLFLKTITFGSPILSIIFPTPLCLFASYVTQAVLYYVAKVSLKLLILLLCLPSFGIKGQISYIVISSVTSHTRLWS